MDGRSFASSYECLVGAVPHGARSVLDMACGDGYLLSLLAARRPELALVGVDFSVGELEAARRRLSGAAQLFQARAQQLPLPDASADVVLCHMALMLMDDAPGVLAQVRRVLRSGGIFCAVVGGGAIDSPPRDAFVGLLRQHRRLPQFESLRLGDRRLYSPEGVFDLFAPAFEAPVTQDILLEWRCSPAGLWDWFGGMYDLGWLAKTDAASVERLFLAAMEPLRDNDGQIGQRVMLRRITACVPAG